MGCCASSSPVDAANPQSAEGGRGSSNAATTSARRSGAISGRGGAPGPISKSNPTSRRNSAVRSLAAASVQVDVNGKPIEPRKKSLFVRSASHRGRMTALAMSFPKIRRSFMAVQNVFDQYCLKKGNQRKELSLDKLGAALNAICTHKQFSDQEVRELFNKADLDGSRSITFREFLIAVGCGYFLKVNIPDNKAYTEIQNGFRVVEKAFNDMDTDKSGSVDAKEMKSALFSLGDAAGTPADGTSVRSLDILEERFAELDFDGDGNIRFPEFLYGFFSWVGMEEDDGALPNRVIDPALVAAAGSTGARPPITMHPAHAPVPLGSPSANGGSGASGGIGDPPPPAAAFEQSGSPAAARGSMDPKAGTASDGAPLMPATPGAVELDPLERQQQENAAIAEQNAILSSLPSARSLKILERAGSTRAAAAAAAIAAAHSPASSATTLQGNGLGGGPDFSGGTDSKRAPKPA